MKYIIRSKTEEDESFLYNSYLKSYHNNYPIKLVPSAIYYKEQAKELKRLFDTATINLAVFPEDANEIIGYVIYEYSSEALVLHYIYIKGMFRKKYIATKIIKELLGDIKLIICTHMFDSFNEAKYKLPGVKMSYDPYFLTREPNGNI